MDFYFVNFILFFEFEFVIVLVFVFWSGFFEEDG